MKFIKIIKLFQSSGYVPYVWALIHGVVAGVEHTNALWSLNCRTVIDVGANCGQFALVTRKCFPQAQIISFEPLVGPANRFRNLFQRDASVILHQAAIGPETGESTFHVAANEDSSSMLPILSMQDRIFPGTSEIRTEMVQVGRLSNFVTPEEIISPAMLKLDVQGYELQALWGCEELLEKFTYVYAECSFIELYSGQALAHDIVHWLGDRGWYLRGVYNIIYDCKGKSVQADFLFENSCFVVAV